MRTTNRVSLKAAEKKDAVLNENRFAVLIEN